MIIKDHQRALSIFIKMHGISIGMHYTDKRILPLYIMRIPIPGKTIFILKQACAQWACLRKLNEKNLKKQDPLPELGGPISRVVTPQGLGPHVLRTSQAEWANLDSVSVGQAKHTRSHVKHVTPTPHQQNLRNVVSSELKVWYICFRNSDMCSLTLQRWCIVKNVHVITLWAHCIFLCASFLRF